MESVLTAVIAGDESTSIHGTLNPGRHGQDFMKSGTQETNKKIKIFLKPTVSFLTLLSKHKQNNNMRLLLTAFISMLFISVSHFATATEDTKNPSPPMISISALKKHHGENFTFRTQAFVVYQYACPECPAGSLCKPCAKNNIVISEKPQRKTNTNETSDIEMTVDTENSMDFILGKNMNSQSNINPSDTPRTNALYGLVNIFRLKPWTANAKFF